MVNSSDTWPESRESSQGWNDNLVTKFIKDFVKKNIDDKDNRIQFVRKIMSAGTVDTELQDQMKSYWLKQDIYGGIDYYIISIYQLKREVGPLFILIKNKIKKVKEVFLQEYDINSDYYNNNLSAAINNKTDKDLDYLLNDEKSRDTFLNDLLGENQVPEKRNYLVYWENFNFSQRVQEKLRLNTNVFDEGQKRKLRELHDAYKWTIYYKLWYFTKEELEDLFNLDFFTPEEKIEMVSTFMTTISLQEARKLEVLDDDQIKVIKDECVNNYLKDWEGNPIKILKDYQVNEIAASLDEKEILINTHDLINNYSYSESEPDEKLNKIFKNSLPEKLHKYISSKIEGYKSKIDKDKPKNLEEFKLSLNQKELDQQITWIEKLWEWSFIQIEKENENWETEYFGIRFNSLNVDVIDDIGASIDWFIWKKDTNNNHFSYSYLGNANRSYYDLYSNLSKNNIKSNIISKNDLSDKEETWEIKIKEKWWSEFINTDEYNSRVGDLESIKLLLQNLEIEISWPDESSIETLELQAIEIQNRLESINQELEELTSATNGWETTNNSRIKHLEKIKGKLGIIHDIYCELLYSQNPNEERLIEEVRTESVWAFSELKEITNYNLNKLRECLDDIDPSWSQFWLEAWTSFLVKWSWTDKDGIFVVDEVDGEYITLSNGEQLWLEEFFNTFKDKKAKRFWKINNTSDFLDHLRSQENFWEEWREYDVKNGKLIKNNNEEKSYNLLIWEWDSFIKIHSFNWNEVEVQFWEVKWWVKSYNEDRCAYFKKETISLSYLSYFIKEWWLKPKYQDKEKRKKAKKDFNRNSWNIISMIFSGPSIAEIIQWWKIIVDSVENFLKEWTDDKASKIALSLFGPLPFDELKKDLKARVQWEEKKRADDYISRLKNLDSIEATALIERWLLNKNCSKYKLEAAVTFMYQEYGSLYAKGLSKYRGTWLWYTALWWEIWDINWEQTKKDSKDENLQTSNFTEEAAVLDLLKKQCWEKWYLWIKRRTRLDKEIKGVWPEWIKKEIEKWYNDAKDTRSIKDINDWFFGELIGWTHNNSFGWMKKWAERWGLLLEDVYEPIIVSLFSWASRNWDQRLTIQIKDVYKWQNSSPIPLCDFLSNAEDADTFSRVVLELCKELEKDYSGEHRWIAREAQEIFNERLDTWKNKESDKIKKTRNFWKRHSKLLVRALHMINGSDTKYKKAEEIVLLNKLNKDNGKACNEELLKYYERMTEISGDFSFTDERYMGDWLGWNWITWMNLYKAMRTWLALTSWPSFKAPIGIVKVILKEYVDNLKSIRDSKELTDEEKKSLVCCKFNDMVAAAWESNSWKGLEFIFSETWILKELLELTWFKELNEDGRFKHVNYEGIKKWENWIKEFFESKAEAFLAKENSFWSNAQEETRQDIFDALNY